MKCIITELRQLVTSIDKEVRSAIEAAFNYLLSQTLYSVSDEWTQKTSCFLQLYSSAQLEKGSLLGQLKHRLGHPSATQELKELDFQAQKTVSELHEYMAQMNQEMREGLGRISQDALDRLEFLTAAWSGLLDGLVMIQHVDLPRRIFTEVIFIPVSLISWYNSTASNQDDADCSPTFEGPTNRKPSG